jgi:hypothetical protein
MGTDHSNPFHFFAEKIIMKTNIYCFMRNRFFTKKKERKEKRIKEIKEKKRKEKKRKVKDKKATMVLLIKPNNRTKIKEEKRTKV